MRTRKSGGVRAGGGQPPRLLDSVKRKIMIYKLLVAALTIITPCLVFAQEGKARSVGGAMIREVFPLVIILMILFVFFRYLLKKNKPQQQRWQDHMDRMEQKYDRIIELMEKMVDNKK
jgi:hypothetical protein